MTVTFQHTLKFLAKHTALPLVDAEGPNVPLKRSAFLRIMKVTGMQCIAPLCLQDSYNKLANV